MLRPAELCFGSINSLLCAKVQGNIVHGLMRPLSAAELTIASAGGTLSRGLAVATLSWIALSFGAWAAGAAPLGVAHLDAILYFGCLALLIAALAGILCGISARRFDRLEVVTNLLTIGLGRLDFVTNWLRRSARTAA